MFIAPHRPHEKNTSTHVKGITVIKARGMLAGVGGSLQRKGAKGQAVLINIYKHITEEWERSYYSLKVTGHFWIVASETGNKFVAEIQIGGNCFCGKTFPLLSGFLFCVLPVLIMEFQLQLGSPDRGLASVPSSLRWPEAKCLVSMSAFSHWRDALYILTFCQILLDLQMLVSIYRVLQNEHSW